VPSEFPSLTAKLRARLRGFPSPSELEPSLSLLGELRRVGWYESFKRGPTMDGEPIPWLTYPAIFWLGSVCHGIGSVFEFGCGNSTLWWAKRSKRVVAVEHDEQWLRRITTPELSTLEIHSASLVDYPTFLAHSAELFDIIVIDGGFDRNACVTPAIDHLLPDGLLVFDDTHLPRHAEGIELLHQAQFGQVDFVGPRPGERFLEATSVFSRDLNRWASVRVEPVFRWGFS
jgi:hypothetical protein